MANPKFRTFSSSRPTSYYRDAPMFPRNNSRYRNPGHLAIYGATNFGAFASLVLRIAASKERLNLRLRTLDSPTRADTLVMICAGDPPGNSQRAGAHWAPLTAGGCRGGESRRCDGVKWGVTSVSLGVSRSNRCGFARRRRPEGPIF